jgi:hypothetical protein
MTYVIADNLPAALSPHLADNEALFTEVLGVGTALVAAQSRADGAVRCCDYCGRRPFR